MQKKILKKGYKLLRICTIFVVIVFATYGFLTLWDTYRTATSAFASYDLLKYRPDIEHDEPPYLDDLLKINPDTAAWLTIYGTNIDYPVMQGKTDSEYLNKKPTGGHSITGSIFLSSANKKDFSDKYNLVYGHHMSNGAMFGDLDKFGNKDYFYNKGGCRYREDEGVLIMQEKVYNLKVLAYVETDSYDDVFYNVYRNNDESLPGEAKEKAKFWRDLGETDKILALSTCNEERTANGRVVVLCQMKKRTDPLPTREEEPLTPHRKAIGHPMEGAYWSLMNLVAMLMTVYLLFPVNGWLKDRSRGKKKRGKFPYIAMTIITASSVVLFVMTENPHQPIQLTDKYTIVQIVLLILVWLIRCRMEGYRIGKGKRDE